MCRSFIVSQQNWPCLFRLFRWRPEYNPKKKSKFATIWIRLPDLPLSIYDNSFVKAIVSTFGYFVDVDEKTKAWAAVSYARACVELDVTKPIPDSVWISLPNEKGYWQSIIVESKFFYYSKCRVNGHNLAVCRKANGAKSSNSILNTQGAMESSEVTLGGPKADLIKEPVVNETQRTQGSNVVREVTLGGSKEVSVNFREINRRSPF